MKVHKYFFLIIPVFLSACSSMYIPSSKNVPLFENKNEVQVEAGVSPNSVYVTGSWAFTKKYAFIVNGSMSFLNFSKRYDIFSPSDWEPTGGNHYIDISTPSSSFLHRYIEGGVGRYNILPASKWKLEVFGGGGYGYALQSPKVSSVEHNFYENKYWMGFVQGNVGRKFKICEYGFSLRMAYSGFNFTFIPGDTDYIKYKDGLKLNFDNIHIEPLAFFRIGKYPIHGFVRVGASITCPLKSFSGINLEYGINDDISEVNGTLDYTILHLSIGLSYRFGGKGNNNKLNNNESK